MRISIGQIIVVLLILFLLFGDTKNLKNKVVSIIEKLFKK